MFSAPIRIELPTIFQMKTVNAWLFKEPEPILIDCGEKTEACWNALLAGLQEHGLQVSDLSKVIITHGHLDHMGMANKITENSKAQIWVSEYVYDWAVQLEEMLGRRSAAFTEVFSEHVDDPQALNNTPFGYERLAPMWDEIPKERLEVFAPDGQLELGGAIWEVLHMPGHCINQSCFYQREQRALLSADMLLSMIPIPIIDAGLEAPYSRTRSLLMLTASYRKLLNYPIDIVYPGHNEPFTHARELIDNQLQRIERRKLICLDFIQQGHGDLMELLHLIYPNRIHPGTYFMTVGFLDILLEEGKIQREMRGSKYFYTAVI